MAYGRLRIRSICRVVIGALESTYCRNLPERNLDLNRRRRSVVYCNCRSSASQETNLEGSRNLEERPLPVLDRSPETAFSAKLGDGAIFPRGFGGKEGHLLSENLSSLRNCRIIRNQQSSSKFIPEFLGFPRELLTTGLFSILDPELAAPTAHRSHDICHKLHVALSHTTSDH